MFRLHSTADVTDTTIMGEVEVAPARLIDRFGLPRKGDDYKISGEYVFTNERGQVFLLHDWKSTNLWDSAFPSPEDFWAIADEIEFSISSHDLETTHFAAWLVAEISGK